MGLAGLTLAAVFFMVGGILVPRIVGRRQALVLSREGDRFSSDLRLLSPPEARTTRSQHGTPMPLLRAEVDAKTEVRMTTQPKLQAPSRPRSATTLRMTSEQIRKLSALKAHRAARIAQARAAAQRRVVTVSAAAVLTLAVVLLAAFSVIGWGWVTLPSLLLAGAVAGSRVAAKNIENAREREEEQFRALQEQVDARGATRLVVATATSVVDEVLPLSAVDAEEEETFAFEDAEAEDFLDQDGPETAAFTTLVVSLEDSGSAVDTVESVEDVTAAAEAAPEVSGSSTWSVQELPVPASVRKAKVVRRSVHVDTDLVSVPEVQGRVVRPLAATGTGDAQQVDVEYAMDLDAVLASRRAQ